MIVAALLLAAGVSYHVGNAQVLTSGPKLRADYPRHEGTVSTYDTVLSDDGGATLIAVNEELKTWFPLESSPFVLTSRYFSGFSRQPKVKKVQWSVTQGPESVKGSLSYITEERVGGTPLRARYSAVIEVWPMPGAPSGLQWPSRVPFKTEIPEIDEKIAAAGLLAAFPKRIALTVTRQYEDGGVPTSETHTLEIHDVQELPSVDPARFTRPASYVEQPPLIGAPGS